MKAFVFKTKTGVLNAYDFNVLSDIAQAKYGTKISRISEKEFGGVFKTQGQRSAFSFLRNETRGMFIER